MRITTKPQRVLEFNRFVGFPIRTQVQTRPFQLLAAINEFSNHRVETFRE